MNLLEIFSENLVHHIFLGITNRPYGILEINIFSRTIILTDPSASNSLKYISQASPLDGYQVIRGKMGIASPQHVQLNFGQLGHFMTSPFG